MRRPTAAARRPTRSLCAALLALSAATTSAEPLPESLRQQINALQQEKAARTPLQRKIASQLLHEERMRRGLPIAAGVPRLRSQVSVDVAGRVEVDIVADVTPALLAHVEALGGTALASLPARRSLRARLPLTQVEALAARPEIDRIRPAGRAYTHKQNTSQGDGAHYANAARSALGIDGSGVTIGVLSDGVDQLASVQDSGDLPAVTVLTGQGGSGSEGTAMLEIVYDLAPGAALMFATGFGSQASFANNIVALRNAGADVIIDDIGYFAEAAFQDDDVAAAVDQVVADGAIYVSSAGNSGNLNDGTAGVFEGDFTAGSSFHGDPGHDFGGGDIRNQITFDSPFAFTLHWADPLLGSGNDYDLYLAKSNGGAILAASTTTQNGNDDPYEIINSENSNDVDKSLIVVLDSGAGRFFHLNANRGRLEHTTAGQTSGHAAARGALGVAAVDARGHQAGFSSFEPVEIFSSDGPRRVFFEADGSAITPGDFSSSGGELRQKPDLSGADCVSTATVGFATFCGTSAAAPHVAAVAALLLERGGGPGVADPDDVRAALLSTAIDIEAPGVDRDSGFGIVHAEDAASAMPITGCTVDPDCDDGAFCNGAETCDAGSCVPGAPPVCNALTPFCSEALDLCAACLDDPDCSDGLFCNGDETCNAGNCDPGTPPVCQGATPECDENSDACVACLTDPDCDDGLFCNGSETCDSGNCRPGAPPQCEEPQPLCDESADACVACLSDIDCDDGLFCSGNESCAAGACQTDPAPVCEAPTPWCDEASATCHECVVDGDCSEGHCNAGSCTTPPAIPSVPSAAEPLLVALALLGWGWHRLRHG